jgi:hypothetical protein
MEDQLSCIRLSRDVLAAKQSAEHEEGEDERTLKVTRHGKPY